MMTTITIVIIIILFVSLILCKRYCYKCSTRNPNNNYQVITVNGIADHNNTPNYIPNNEADTLPKYTDLYTIRDNNTDYTEYSDESLPPNYSEY